MDHVTPPIGLIGKAFGWLRDLAAMPGRVRLLAEAVEKDNDGRLRCTSCKDGRVGDLKKHPTVAMGMLGTCSRCGTIWQISKANGLVAIY